MEAVGFVNKGVKARPNLVVLKRTTMPAVLVELGFINSDTDNQLFDDNFEDIAQAIAEGILDTLEMDGIIETENRYQVQVGAFRNPAYANRVMNELKAQDYPAVVQEENGYFRVRVGEYADLDDASDMERRLKRAGYPTLIVST